MSSIQILTPEVAGQIAAGEVVERPASVVKELIENALDAGATAIQIEIAAGGVGLVRVSDNGGGMARADAPLALERFSTSKVHTLADLDAIRTLGFRGEALAAIAAAARVSILTRTAAELEGTRVMAVGGQVGVEPAASPVGCSVSVSDLFYHTPARRKYLKSVVREAELCQQTIIRYALAHSDVAFRLAVDGVERLVAPPALPHERLALAVGREAAAEMIPIAWEAADLRVHGLVSSPAIGRSRRERQFFFLNRRPIRSGLLAVVLERPYGGRLPAGRYPLAVVHLDLNPAMVDVNVHPRKAEVRFAQERAVYQALSQAVAAALAPFPVQATLGTPGWPFPETPLAPMMIAEAKEGYYPGQPAKLLGQVQDTYLVAQIAGGLMIVDQHAAHEAILTERLLAGGPVVSLSPAVRLELTGHEAERLAAHLALFADLGWEVEPFGRNSFVVRTAPASLALQDPVDLWAHLLEELAGGQTVDPEALRERLASTAACRAAVKAGDRLGPDRQQALLDDLLATWSPSTCPHGRPTLFVLTVEEMERRFLRR